MKLCDYCDDPDCKIPYGTCHCTCGGETKIAPRTARRDKRVRGRPVLFINGHVTVKPRPKSLLVDDAAIVLIPLTQGQVATIDASKLIQCPYRYFALATKQGGFKACRWSRVDGKNMLIQMSHDIVGRPPKGKVVDHIDGDGLNNREANLRTIGFFGNNQNRNTDGLNKYGYTGIWFSKSRNKYCASITANGKRHILGRFDTAEKSGQAYEEASERLFGEYKRRKK